MSFFHREGDDDNGNNNDRGLRGKIQQANTVQVLRYEGVIGSLLKCEPLPCLLNELVVTKFRVAKWSRSDLQRVSSII